jgi:fructose-1,6-bisphosphatase/inositol monophosphatase family enzyme
MVNPIEERYHFGIKIAKSLSQYQLGIQHKNLSLERKQDGTPVTEVDKASEEMFRKAVAAAFPEDAILGEEGSDDDLNHKVPQNDSARWVIDPIDGTRKFMRGLPFWGICIAYEVNGEVELGIMAIPGAGVTYSAMRGQGAFCNGKPINCETSMSLPETTILTMPPRPCFVDGGWGQVFDETQRWIEHDPGFLDAYSYGMVADGRIHGLLSCGDKWWDIAAAVCICRESGARFTNLRGQKPSEGELNLAASPSTADWLLPRLEKLGCT